jgi:hypothetical protein
MDPFSLISLNPLDSSSLTSSLNFNISSHMTRDDFTHCFYAWNITKSHKNASTEFGNLKSQIATSSSSWGGRRKCCGGITVSTTEDFPAVRQEAAELCRIGPYQATLLLHILVKFDKFTMRWSTSGHLL